MAKVFGVSDDLVEIENTKYFDDEIGCYRRDVKLWFDDDTVVRVHYGTYGIWRIKIEKHGRAEFILKTAEEIGEDAYSDELNIFADVIRHKTIREGEG